ncbi:hypothetical protein ABID14_001840 [Peptoniphilus olsenii]|uniref:Uncharacterized protein n=1 Tax=Peptoniphilus olsenii TaxID=411570 RepID=A0ABV2JBR5_9FIRM
MGTLNSVSHIRYIYPFLWLGLLTHSNNTLPETTK